MSSNNTTNNMKINGSPTKDLFISMLIKDISLTDGICDLIDNSIDGALRLHAHGDFSGYNVEITVNEDKFIIKDNCGGIPAHLARDYAFKFGRDEKMPPIPSSVGQFGIGMKRALFKMGNKFCIKSVNRESRFTVDIDVNNWCKKPEWDFKFTSLEEKSIVSDYYGTEIIVSYLKNDVKEQFKNDGFVSELKNVIKLKHSLYLTNGLKIKINNLPLESSYLGLLDSNDFRTAFYEKKFYDTKFKSLLKVKLYAGIAEEDSKKGGWYIFCNDRLIVGPEQTSLTGWGVKKPVTIPYYHIQFNRFRGYAFFNSKKTDMLPWNTSKTNVDIDSGLFKFIRDQMIYLMRPIIDFLNEVHSESVKFHRQKIPTKILENAIVRARLKSYLKVKTSTKFIYLTRRKEISGIDMVKISYEKPSGQVEELGKFFNTKSPKKIGELSFDYVYKRECEK